MEEENTNALEIESEKQEETKADLIIQTHDFEEAKNKIKTFADNAPTSPEFRKFSTSDGPFGWFDHRVTGTELNNFVKTLQEYLISFNERDDEFVNEFRHVYEAFESLDRDYIQAILIAVKSAEKASQEAKDAQKDVDITIERLHQAIKSLSQFKNEINSYEHLKDVDKIWEDVKILKSLVNDSYSKSRRGKRKRGKSKGAQPISDIFIDYPQKTEEIQQLAEQNTKMTRHIKILSIVSCCSLLLVAAEIVLHLTGVL